MRRRRLDIVPAEARHGAILADLEAACFDTPWSESQLLGELVKAGGQGWIAHRVPSAVAYALFTTVADEAELLRLAVLPAHRGAGCADALLRRGLGRLASQGITRCHLEVAEDNRPALAVYRRHGFRAVGRRPGYYRRGVDAVLMARPLERDGRASEARTTPAGRP
ncbi:MAG: GNAT family N-acetyltransferase [Acidobacteriota bacterium]